MSSGDTFNVAITGNAPFMEYDFNTSQLVRDAMPSLIRRENGRDIRILKYNRDTIDTYEDVRCVTKDIWGGKASLFAPLEGYKESHVGVDLILHLGMVALGSDPNQFRFEKVARRDGYRLPGDDKKYVNSQELEALGLPENLATSLDVDAAWLKVQQLFPNVSSCVSNDAGHYFCEFRLYSSLAEPYLDEALANKRGRVVFEHLPQAHDVEAIALARDVTVAYITSLANDPLFKREVLKGLAATALEDENRRMSRNLDAQQLTDEPEHRILKNII